MKSKLLHLFLSLFLVIVLFQSDLLAVRIETKIPDQSNRNIEPGTPMTLTPCVAGMAGPYPCNKVDLLAFVPLSSMGCTDNGNVVEGWVDPLDGKEYALMGCANGVSFLDLSDPVNPVYLGRLPPHTVNSLWRDVRVYSNGTTHRMYVGSEASGHGIQVFDLTRLRGVITPQTFTEDAHYPGLGNSHTIFLNNPTGFLFAVGSGGAGNQCTSGLHMINVQNLIPTFAGCFGGGIYTHEVTCVIYNGPDSTYVGNEICFAANGDFGNNDRLVISDVTNKSSPVQLSSTGYLGAGYCHQVWLTEDHRYLLMNDELDEFDFGVNTTTIVWDISDLNAPVVIDNFVHQTTSIDHNLYVKGNYVYESNYSAGLRILDLTDVSTGVLDEVAYFDVWPANDVTDFEGTWDNYPFLPSGIVLVSGIFGAQTAGLFILQPTIDPDFNVVPQDPIVNACGTGSAQTTINVSPLAGYTGSVTLSAIGLPAGASAGFIPNPVTVPGSSTMTITLSGTPAGNYPFDVQGTDGTLTNTAQVTLNVATSVLSAPVLLNPPDNAIDQLFVVHYEWNPVTGASSYDLEVANDSQFNNIIYSVNETEDHHTGFLTLDPLTQYWWRVGTINACGASAWSAAFTFTTAAPANILLVDDDNNDPDVLSYYQDAISFAGQNYDVWDTTTQGITNDPEHLDEPDATTLSNYQMVIWFSGDAGGGSGDPKAGPSENSEMALTQYLNAGGCFFLTSEEYFADRGLVLNSFQADVLGASSINNDVSQTSVTGNGIFSGIGTLSLIFPSGLSNLTDRITPNTSLGAQVAFSGNQGNAGISWDTTGTSRTIFLGFPFEAISSQIKRREVMQTAIDFCLNVPCPTITLSSSTLPDGTQGTAYNQTITASGGAAPYSFALTVGTPPAGITLSSAGVLSGTPTANGTFNFTVTATDSDGCTGSLAYSLTIAATCGLLCDDFEDGILSTMWTYEKPAWSESGGDLIGAPVKKKAIAIATPIFAGCSGCTVQAGVSTTGGIFGKVWLYGWRVNKDNVVEVLMKEENNKWVLRQRVNGTIVAKDSGVTAIDPNVNYTVQVAVDGSTFTLTVDGVVMATITAVGTPNGTVGFAAKNTTGTFELISVN